MYPPVWLVLDLGWAVAVICGVMVVMMVEGTSVAVVGEDTAGQHYCHNEYNAPDHYTHYGQDERYGEVKVVLPVAERTNETPLTPGKIERVNLIN